jgi:REP element-mobilizing transposase RayT
MYGPKKRLQFAGGIFHVWARRVDRSPLFVDEDDYRRYVALLAATVVRCDWILLSFCLMPNHVHLLVELRKANLAKGMTTGMGALGGSSSTATTPASSTTTSTS